jgi:hypothetical protein
VYNQVWRVISRWNLRQWRSVQSIIGATLSLRPPTAPGFDCSLLVELTLLLICNFQIDLARARRFRPLHIYGYQTCHGIAQVAKAGYEGSWNRTVLEARARAVFWNSILPSFTPRCTARR